MDWQLPPAPHREQAPHSPLELQLSAGSPSFFSIEVMKSLYASVRIETTPLVQVVVLVEPGTRGAVEYEWTPTTLSRPPIWATIGPPESP